MPTLTIPLIGAYDSRGLLESTPGKDYRALAAVFTTATDQLTQSTKLYLNKRLGWSAANTPQAGSEGAAIFLSPQTGAVISAFGIVNSTIYSATTNCGTISGVATHISEVVIGNVAFYMITSFTGGGWYLASDSFSQLAYTADGNNSTTITDIKVSGVNSVAGLYVGQLLTAGANIAAGSRIVSIDSAAFSAVLSLTTTGGAFNDLAITKTPLAKIIDADFPADITGEFVGLDGRVYILTAQTRRIYGSDINSVSAWTASNYITAEQYSGFGIGLAKQSNRIVAFCNSWFEVFYNSGNSTGSVLSRDQGMTKSVGAVRSTSSLISTVGDSIFFVSGEGAGTRVYRMGNFNPERISGAYEESILNNTSPDNISAFYAYGGLNVSINSATYDLVYLGATSKWTEPNWTVGLMIASQNTGLAGLVSLYAISPISTSGKVYTINNTVGEVYTDDGASFTMTIQTQPYALNNGLPFIINNINLLADTQSSGSTTLATSADDYATFGTVGSFDLTSQQKNLPGGGYYDTSVAFKLTDAGNNAWRGQALVVDWEPA